VLEQRRARAAAAVDELSLGALLVSRLSNVRDLTGFTGSAGYVIVTGDGEPARLVVDVRYRDQASEQAQGVAVIGDAAPPHLWPTVLGFLRELDGGGCGVEGAHLSAGQYVDMQENGLDVVATRNVVERHRALKDEYEIRRLREAGEIADAVLEHVAHWLRPGLTERRVAGEVELKQRELGAAASATEVIVASGPRSALPHGRASERELAASEPVMLDISPTVDGYRADITRTFHLGEPSDEFRAIYDLVAEAQRRSEAAVRPGAGGREVDRVARAIIEDAGHGPRFEHSLGHGVGLDVHELPLISPHDDAVLAAGMVVTIEPGVYLPGVGGVRIENSVVVRDDGPDSLNRFTTELVAIPIR
jgi:Xaa-Pro aminopeptidase